jgi:PA14 domain
MRLLRKLATLSVILPLALTPLLFPVIASADTVSGLTQDVYTYDPSSTPDRITDYKLCNTSVVSNINFDVGGGVVADCQQDFVLIHWYGYITLPVDGEITFQSMADDGFYLDIDGQNVINDWTLKGCGGSSGTHTFQSGISQKVDIWWYEFGGGACNYLYYTDPVTGFNLVPDSAWTTEPQVFVEPPVVEPPVIPEPQPTTPVVIPEPPVVDPVPVDPPVDPQPPVIPDPPVVDPIPVDPPVVPPVIPDPPVVVPPVIPEPPVVVPPVVIPDPPVVVPPVVPEPQPEPQGDPNIPAVITDLSKVDLQAVDPTQLTTEQATQLKEAALVVFETATEGSPEYQQALDALYLAAQQDDIVVDPGIANIPGVGQAAVAIANVLNAIGNVGADISPKARKKAQTLVVTTLVVGQIAQTAALATASGGSSSSNRTNRRKQ